MLDSATRTPLILFNSFAKRAAPPAPLPLTFLKCVPKKLRFFAFRGRASLSPLLAKNRRLHFCNLESDFLHHEAGEFSGASHKFNVDSADSQNLGENNPSLRDSAKQNRGKPHYENIAESQSGLPRRFCESARNDGVGRNKSYFTKPRRIAHFATFPLIGGESAIKDISKIALGILFSVYGRAIPLESRFKNVEPLYQMQQKGINSPKTSSVGRIYDFVAFMCGLESQSFEGESGGYVESLYNPRITAHYGFEIHNGVISLQQIVHGIVGDYKADSCKSRTIIATKFINTLAQIILQIALENRTNRPNLKVIFSGGVFANKILCDKITSEFRVHKIAHHFHSAIPTNDGGIAVGQIVAYLRGDFEMDFENDFENGDFIKSES